MPPDTNGVGANDPLPPPDIDALGVGRYVAPDASGVGASDSLPSSPVVAGALDVGG